MQFPSAVWRDRTTGEVLQRTSPCPCGSTIALQECHALDAKRPVPPDTVRAMLAGVGVDSSGIHAAGAGATASAGGDDGSARRVTSAESAHECAACGARTTELRTLMRCSRCKRVRYCSRACQSWHWHTGVRDDLPAHKDVCREAAQ